MPSMRALLLLALVLPAAAQAPQTLKLSSQLVVVNVSVSDGHGNPLRGLRADQFHVSAFEGPRQDEVPQRVASLDEHTAPDPGQAWALPVLPEGIYSNIPGAPVADAFTVLLLDSQGTAPDIQQRLHQQLVKFVQQSPPGIRIAIFRFGPRLQLLQGFTSDRTQLEEALARPESLPAMPIPNPRPDLEEGNNFDTLTRYLAKFPGRKNILWFAATFPTQDPFDLNQNILFGDLNVVTGVDSLFGADPSKKDHNKIPTRDIVLYPIDPQAIQAPPMFQASQGLQAGNIADVRSSPDDDIGRSAGLAASNAAASRLPNAFAPRSDRDSALAQTAMEVLAHDTGGKAFYNGNNLAGEIDKAITLGSSYYTVAFVPTRPALDGSTHKLDIGVSIPGAHLSYRHTYIAQQTAIGDPHEDPARLALERGSPDATQILFRTRVVPMAPQPTLAPPAGELAGKLKGQLIRYAIDWAADAHGINMAQTGDGLHHAAVTVTTVAYDGQANPLNVTSQRIEDSLTPDQYTAALHGGLRYHQELDLPLGTDFVRLVLTDGKGRVGSTEVALKVTSEPVQPKEKTLAVQ